MKGSNTDQVTLSVIIPAFNEELSIREVLEGVVKSTEKLNREIIVVDDGSTDKTAEIVKEFTKKYDFIHLYQHEKNMGQTEAFKTGFKNSHGKFIACIDADLQNDPNDIIKLLAYCRKEPHTYATAWRKKRMDPFFRKVISLLYNTILNSLFDVRLFDVYGKPKVFERELVEKIEIETKEMAWDLELAHKAKKLGYKVINVPVSHRRRKGISKASVVKGIPTTASLLEYRIKSIFSKKIEKPLAPHPHE